MNNNQVVEENEEETTSQDSSPQSEESTIADQTPQEEPKAQETQEGEQEESSDVVMTEGQRKAFQEMRLENKRLKEEMDARKKGESAFDAFRPKPAGPVDINNFVDNSTGNVDWNRYNQAVITQAKTEATQSVNEQLDEEKARNKYPEVFADPDLEEAIAGRWFAAKLRGENVTISDLASKYSRKFSSATTKAEKEGAKKALTELSVKEQAALSAQTLKSSSANQVIEEEHEVLKSRARHGDDDALAQLMKSVSWKQ